MCGSRATSATASTSRSRWSCARVASPNGPSARRAPRPRCATRAASGSTRSPATRATSTSPTSTSRAARCARRMAAGELSDRDSVEAAAQILDALAHAHQKGIVHRDVKPSNVLLAESDGIDVRLLDFGLAQMEEFDTLTAGRRRPRDAHLRLARAPRRPRPRRRRRRLGGRGDALGVARGQASVPLEQRGRHDAPDQGGRAAARGLPARPAAAAPRRRRRRRCIPIPNAARARPRSPPSCASEPRKRRRVPGQVEVKTAEGGAAASWSRSRRRERVARRARRGDLDRLGRLGAPVLPGGLAARADDRNRGDSGSPSLASALAFAFAVTLLPALEHLARARDRLRARSARSGSR